MPIIKLEKLTKVFDKKVVDNVILEINEGEIFGLLGPNGAGKTTLLRMLSGLTKPTEGTGIICGYDITKDAKKVRSIIGIVPQGDITDRDLNVKQNLIYHAKLHKMKKQVYQKKIKDVIDLLELEEAIFSKIDNLSGGIKRRVNIAKALLHEPKVLFLDEPTVGLDVQSRLAVWEKIKSLKEKGITMILTTHYMEEADYLCDRIAIIDLGKIIALDTPNKLKKMLPSKNIIEITISEDFDFEKIIDMDKFKALEFIQDLSYKDRKIKIQTNDKKKVISKILSEFGKKTEVINFHETTLEDLFIHLTGKELRE